MKSGNSAGNIAPMEADDRNDALASGQGRHPGARPLDDTGYIAVVVFTMAVVFLVYFGHPWLVAASSLTAFLAGILFTVAVNLAWNRLVTRRHLDDVDGEQSIEGGGTPVLGEYEKARMLAGVPDEVNSSGVLARYRSFLREIDKFDAGKRRFVESSLLPQLQELIERRLPELLERRNRYQYFSHKYSVEGIESEIASIEDRLSRETDRDIRAAMERNLSLARSTREQYLAIEKGLRLYDLQISNIERHLQHLEAKLQVLDIDEQDSADSRDLLEGIDDDMTILEATLRQVDSLDEHGERGDSHDG